MKKIFTIMVVGLLTASVFAQAPEKMSYQAIVRDASDKLVSDQGIGMQISILQSTETGTAVYVETQSPTTNINGLVSIKIGNGTVVSGDFTTIDWANDIYFIKTETDPTTLDGTNYTISGVSQLLSVPYALHAKTAENTFTGSFNDLSDIPGNLDTDATDDFDGDYNNLSNVPTNISALTNDAGYLTSEEDGDASNELQTLSISNDTIYLTDGSFAKLPGGFTGSFNDLSDVPANLDTDATDDFDGDYNNLSNAPTNVSALTNDAGYLTSEVDDDASNELQTLSISNDTIYLTDGSFVKLPAGFTGSFNDLSDVPVNLDTDATDDFDGDYNNLSNAPTNVSVLTNDAGYLTSEEDGSVTNEIQVLSIINDTIYLSNGGFVKIPNQINNSLFITGNLSIDTVPSPLENIESNATNAICNPSSFGQGFTSTETASISIIEIKLNNGITQGTVTLDLYNGMTNSGDIAYTETITISSDPGAGWYEFVLSTPFPVVSGNEYSFKLVSNDGCIAGNNMSVSNPYSGGNYFANGAAQAGWDAAFKVNYIIPVLYANTSSGNVGIGIDNPSSKLSVTGGDINVQDIGSGIILKSPDGNCWRVTVDDTGAFVSTSITCP